jgi:hypothetical protein
MPVRKTKTMMMKSRSGSKNQNQYARITEYIPDSCMKKLNGLELAELIDSIEKYGNKIADLVYEEMK